MSRPTFTAPQVAGDQKVVLEVAVNDGTSVAKSQVTVGITDVNQTINGTAGNDVIDAKHGNDIVNAGAGNDVVYGGLGNDRIDGGAGNDLPLGNEGNDTIIGGSGSDTINGGDGSDTAVVSKAFTVEIAGVNDSPYDIKLDNTNITEKAKTGDIVANLSAIDVDGDRLTFRVMGGSAQSFVVVGNELRVADGARFDAISRPIEKITIEVNDGRGGVEIREVEIAIANVNDVATTRDDMLVATEDTPLQINPATLLANDFDIDGDKLQIVSVSNAEHGTVTLLEDGQIEFRADANYSGPAKFSYTVTDAGGLTSTATVEIQVNAVAVADVVPIELVAAVSESDVDGLATDEVVALADKIEPVDALSNAVAANPTQAELPQVIVPQAISEPEGVSDASNAAATDFVRSNAVIGQTVRDLESLASELRGNDPIGLTAPEYENPNQYVTLPPLEKIDWSNVKFNDLVDLESDASSVEFETSRTEARVFANRSGQSDTAVEQDEVVATQKNESSTLSNQLSS